MTSWASQFSSGDQGNYKEDFWRNGFKTCPKCAVSKITKDSHGAGCRHNGDGYGTDVFTCQKCGWSTSFQYDDAAEYYYYETRLWDREPPPPIPRQQLTAEFKAKFKRIFKMIGPRGTYGAMEQDGISAEDIDAFLTQLVSEAEEVGAGSTPAATAAATSTLASSSTSSSDVRRKRSSSK